MACHRTLNMCQGDCPGMPCVCLRVCVCVCVCVRVLVGDVPSHKCRDSPKGLT